MECKMGQSWDAKVSSNILGSEMKPRFLERAESPPHDNFCLKFIFEQYNLKNFIFQIINF